MAHTKAHQSTPKHTKAYQSISKHIVLVALSCCSIYPQQTPNTIVDTIYGIPGPTAIAVTPTGSYAYICNQASTISAVNLATNLAEPINDPSFNSTSAIAVTPNGNYAYVVNESSPGSVSVIDINPAHTTTFNTVIDVITDSHFDYPSALAITPDGNYAYITNLDNNDVVVISLATNTTFSVINDGSFQGSEGVAITPNGDYAFVTNSNGNSVSIIDTDPASPGYTTVITTIGGFQYPTALAITPNGDYAYIINNNNRISVLETTAPYNITTLTGFNNPSGIAITQDGASAYVTNGGNNSVSVIALPSNVVTTYAGLMNTFNQPFGIAFAASSSNQAYVTNNNGYSMSVVNTNPSSSDYNTVSVTIGGFNNSFVIEITPDGTRAYVVDTPNGAIAMIDLATNTATVPAGLVMGINQPNGLAITPNGNFAYVSSGGSNGVYVVDINPLSSTYNTTTTIITHPNFFGTTQGIAVNPNGSYVYVAGESTDTVTAIDTANNTIFATITNGNFSSPYALAITPDGTRAYVTNAGTNTVSVVDIINNNYSATINGDFADPQGIAITPDGSRAYVVNTNNATITVIDTNPTSPTYNTVIATITGFNGSQGYLALTNNGNYAYVTDNASQSVAIVDINPSSTTYNMIIQTITGLPDPQGIALTPNNAYAYVVNHGNVSNSVSVIYTGIVSAPVGASGCKRKNIFLNQIDHYNHLTWFPPTGTAPVAYRIYRDAGLTQLVATVKGINEYDDHNRNPRINYTYYIVAVSSSGNLSTPAVLTVTQSC